MTSKAWRIHVEGRAHDVEGVRASHERAPARRWIGAPMPFDASASSMNDRLHDVDEARASREWAHR
jgi:hypothetical protein